MVYFIMTESIPVGIDRLITLPILSLQKTKDVPADVWAQVVSKPTFNVVVRLLLLTRAVEDEAFHG